MILYLILYVGYSFLKLFKIDILNVLYMLKVMIFVVIVVDFGVFIYK